MDEYKCDKCNRQYNNKEDFDKHISKGKHKLDKSANKPIEVPIKFVAIRAGTRKKHACFKCLETFNSFFELDLHIIAAHEGNLGA